MNRIQRFDRSIYSIDAIKSAISAYREIASICMTIDHDVCLCEFQSTVYPLQITMHEFANYVLDLTVEAVNNYAMD